MRQTPLVVNFYGGPGSGKSTTAARVFARLKDLNMNVELVTEYAKDQTWQESFNVLNNQIYIFAKQLHRMWRLRGKVDIIVTDSSLLNSIVYDKEDNVALSNLIVQEFKKFNNFNIFLQRVKPYNEAGRSQSIQEAIELDDKTLIILRNTTGGSIDKVVKGEAASTNSIIESILEHYKKTM